MKTFRYLVRSSREGVCFCRCRRALAASPGQADCPWCGCGWLFSCMTCRKAFSFATCVEIRTPYEELARRDLTKLHGGRKPSAWEIKTWTRSMADVMGGLRVGREYVYLDGSFVPSDEAVEFDGWYSHHFLARLPHDEFRGDPAKLKAFFSRREYWTNSRVEAEDF